jgi:soluble lytic murein transglycosylase-like protein
MHKDIRNGWGYPVVDTRRTSIWGVVIMLTCLFLASILLLASCMAIPARADVIDMNAIMIIESQGNPNAIGTSGEIGLYQIMPCVLAEYNQFNKVNLQPKDLFNPLVNEQVARWYMGVRLPQLFNHFRKPITTNNIIWAWNAGIGRFVKNRLPKTTRDYLVRYARLARKA